MTITEEQQSHLKALLEIGDELAAIRYLQENLGLSADEAVKMTEELSKTVSPSSIGTMFGQMKRMSRTHGSGSKIGKYIGRLFMFVGLVMFGVVGYIGYSQYIFCKPLSR